MASQMKVVGSGKNMTFEYNCMHKEVFCRTTMLNLEVPELGGIRIQLYLVEEEISDRKLSCGPSMHSECIAEIDMVNESTN